MTGHPTVSEAATRTVYAPVTRQAISGAVALQARGQLGGTFREAGGVPEGTRRLLGPRADSMGSPLWERWCARVWSVAGFVRAAFAGG